MYNKFSWTEFPAFVPQFRFFAVDTWRNKDERGNVQGSYDREIILNSKRTEVEDEIRRRVDMQMRDELDSLKMVRILFLKFLTATKAQEQGNMLYHNWIWSSFIKRIANLFIV